MLTPVIVSAAALIVAVLVAGGFFLYVYWWLVQRPTPKLDGAIHLSILDRPVEILRDRHGIPHLYAQSLADLMRSQGYVHAQERLWQMEQNRRIARGTLAEVYGEAALEADRFSRIVGFRRAAERELVELDSEMQQVLAWYSEGVNAYIANHPGRLGAEFNLLRVTPEPWQPVDTVAHAKVMAWGLGVNWESELTRLRLQAQIGAVRAADLEPDYPAGNPVIAEAAGSVESVRLLSTAGLLLNEYEKVKPWLGHPVEGRGSNAWAIAPKHSTTRRALLCNDPHLALQMPGVWFENHLTCPGYEVSGVSFAGAPGVIIGHNAQIAWGMTNAYSDVQDLFIERAHPDDPHLFANGETWEVAQVIQETIAIRGREAYVEEIVITRHGPLISNLIPQSKTAQPLALQWVGHAPGQTVRSVLALNRAQNWTEFQAALEDWAAPAQTVVYADSDGNIGMVLAGAIPQRGANLGLLPAPGWDGAYDWSSMIPNAELPRLYNPPSGMIVTANNKIVGDDYPHFMGVEYLPGWRAARLEALLSEKERFNLRDMEEMQFDTGSTYAAALAPHFAKLDSDDPYVKVAITYLRKWDFRMDSESAAALIFHYALIYLLDEVFGKKLGELREPYYGMSGGPIFLINGFLLRAQSRLLELVAEPEGSFWFADTASGAPRSREEALHRALAEAVKRLRAEFGDNARRWAWGRAHQVRYTHPLGSVRLFRSLFNRGPFPVGGDGTTPNQAYSPPVLPVGLVQVTASYRQVFEVGVWDNSRSVTTSGQSGHVLSPHYADQIAMWREGVYHPMPWSRGAVDEAAVYRSTLTPPVSS